MKKITLKNLNLKEIEQLSREQLKNVLGGYTGETGGGTEDGTTDPNPKITACNGKKKGDFCSWLYQGNYYHGYCKEIAPNYVLHCSDLI